MWTSGRREREREREREGERGRERERKRRRRKRVYLNEKKPSHLPRSQWCGDGVGGGLLEWQWHINTSTFPTHFRPTHPLPPSSLLPLPPFSAERFLRWIEKDQREELKDHKERVLFLGDSLSRNMADSLR